MSSAILLNKGIPELPDCWLKKAYEYLKSKCKTPDIITFWTLIAFCGAAMRNKYYFDLAGKRVFPNFPLMIIADSGKGKTSAINACRNIFDRCLPSMVPENCTPEAITLELEKFSNGEIAAGFWTVPELAEVFGKKDYQRGSITRLTRLLDNPKDWTSSRVKDENKTHTINGYVLLNFIGASTFEWLVKYVESSASDGGFLPRFFIASSNDKAKFVLNGERDYRIEQDLNAELFKKLFNLAGIRIPLFPEIQKIQHDIYELTLACENNAAEPFYERMTENFLRLFLIFKFFLADAYADEAMLNTTSVQLSFTASKFFLDKNLELLCCITTNNNLEISILRKVVNKLNRYVGKNLSFFACYNGLHIPAEQFEKVVRFLYYNNWLEWNQLTGRQGLIKAKVNIPFNDLMNPERATYVEENKQAAGQPA